MKKLAIFAALFLAIAFPVSAQRYMGGPPGEQAFSSLAPCTAQTASGHAAVNDSTTPKSGMTISGNGTYHVDAVCEATQSGGAYAWVVATSVGSPSGVIDVRNVGFLPSISSTFDNATRMTALNNAMGSSVSTYDTPGDDVFFPKFPNNGDMTWYYFTNPYEIYRTGTTICGSGSRAPLQTPSVILAFAPGSDGVIFDDDGNSPLATPRGGNNLGAGSTISNMSGCFIYSLGYIGASGWTTGSPTFPAPNNTALTGVVNGGHGATLPAINYYIGDGIVPMARAQQFNANGATLTAGSTSMSVTTFSVGPGGGTTDTLPPIGSQVVDGTLVGVHLSPGTYVQALTGTGPYTLTLTRPALAAYSGQLQVNPMQTQPLVAPGSYITSCSGSVGNLCHGYVGTLTLNNNFSNGDAGGVYLLPGPNAPTGGGQPGPQNYTVSTSLTGNWYGPILGGNSGTTFTASGSIPGGALRLGQQILGLGGSASTTTTGSTLTIGQTAISTNGCPNLNGTIYVYASASSNNVFAPATTMVSCTGAVATTGTLVGGSGYSTPGTYTNVPLTGGSGSSAQATIVVSGGAVTSVTITAGGVGYVIGNVLSAADSNIGGRVGGAAFSIPVATVNTATMTVNSTSYTATLTNTSTVAQGIWGYYVQPWHLYIGQPVTGTNIPAGTTYQGLNRYVPYNPGFWDANLSQAATGTGSQTLTFGGAIYAAPAGTTVTFLAGTGTIVGCDTACNTASTYLIDASYTLGGGSTVYAIDTPATVYVTAGPRPLHTQKLLWSSDFLFGSVIQKVYGTSQSQQTVIIGETGIRQPSNAIATAGKFWTIPTGVLRQVQSTLAYNTIDGFGVGVSSMCQPTNNPGSSCGKLLDTFNNVGHDIVGNLVTGNNSSGSQYFSNTYTSSFYTDVLELASVGSAYFGTMHLSIDNSFTSYGPIGFSCGTNQSVLYGAYLSGAEWSYSCPPTNMPMIGQMTVPGTPLIHGDTWQTTADSTQTSVARKVGWNGITLGTNANTDAGGVLTLSGGTASYAFTYDYNAAPICGVMQDITTPANTATTTVVVTNKKLTINGTGTDQIGYFCFGRN